MATKIQAATIGLVLIGIIVASGALFYAMGLPGLSDSIDELRSTTSELATAEAELASVLEDLGAAVGEYTGEISAIQERLAAVEELLKPPPPPDTLRIALPVDFTNFDSANTGTPALGIVFSAIYEGLVRTGTDGEARPALAETWSTTDAQTWIFNLRRGVTFHDGTPFNASCVKYTFDRLLDPDVYVRGQSFIRPYLDSTEVIDDYTVKLVLKFPYAPYIGFVNGHIIASPTNIEKYDGYDNEAFGTEIEHACGTGPYKVTGWVRGDHVRLARNEDYWAGEPQLKEVIYRVITDSNSRALALMAGDVDVCIEPPIPILSAFEDKPETFKIVTATNNGYTCISFNSAMDPFTDKRVRQAMNYAIDKEAILENILKGYFVTRDSAINPTQFGYFQNQADGWPYDPDMARQLLADAGYADGLEFENYYVPGSWSMADELMEAVQGYLAEVDVTMNLAMVEYGTFIPLLRKYKAESVMQAFSGSFPRGLLDADYCVKQYYTSYGWPDNGGSSKQMFYDNPRVTELWEMQTNSANATFRLECFEEICQLVWDDAVEIFLFWPKSVVAMKKNVQGFEVLPTSGVLGITWDTRIE